MLKSLEINPPKFGSPSAWVPVAIALIWLLILMTASDLGVAAYAIPLLALGSVFPGFIFVKAMQGRPYATLSVIILIFFVLNINFRDRPPGEIGLDWQNGVKLITWLGLSIIVATRWKRIGALLREPLVILCLTFVMISFVSSLWSEVPYFTGASAIGWFAYFGLGCLLYRDVDEDTAIRVMLWTLVFYVALGAIGGIAVPGSTWSLPSPEEETVRLKGFSGQPNVFASHIGVFIILTLIARKKGLIGRVAGVGMLVLGLSTLIATGSRTTLIAVLIAWGLVAIRGSRIGRPIFIAIAGIVSLFLVLAVSNSLPDLTGVIGKFSRSGSDSEILTLTGRTDIWEVVWTKVMQKPFFGWGFNGTEALLLNSFDKSFYGTAVNAHNMYLQALISLGFIGALPAFGLVFLLIWRCMQSSDQVRDLPIAYVLFHGTAEAQIFMTPDILLIVSSWVIAREAVKRLGSACPSM